MEDFVSYLILLRSTGFPMLVTYANILCNVSYVLIRESEYCILLYFPISADPISSSFNNHNDTDMDNTNDVIDFARGLLKNQDGSLASIADDNGENSGYHFGAESFLLQQEDRVTRTRSSVAPTPRNDAMRTTKGGDDEKEDDFFNNETNEINDKNREINEHAEVRNRNRGGQRNVDGGSVDLRSSFKIQGDDNVGDAMRETLNDDNLLGNWYDDTGIDEGI